MKARTKAEVLDGLRGMKPSLTQRFGISRIGVFGSVARDQMRADSDIDIVVEMANPDLFSLVHLKDALEESLGSPVDIVQYREKMNPFLKAHIQNEAVYV
ncbi:MAG: Nucleotidyltransferase domain protein [Candidatus Hydrogenedentes bacterium ADurb.Bin179]|nr:MAG: Nucleotidyltransferase domain protein [Candidatus Hydrogenedentes bacterium ADurb.Bin179]